MPDDDAPVGRGRPPSVFQRWVAGVLAPFPPALRIVIVLIICVALVLLPLVLFLSA
jgi:hypothetical protein